MFQYIMSLFPQFFDAKLKEGIFDRAQIRKLLKDDVFVTKMTLTKKTACLYYKNVVEKFFWETLKAQNTSLKTLGTTVKNRSRDPKISK